MEKYLYFRTVADEANDGVTGLKTNNPSSFLFPASTLTAIQPTGDAALTLYFTPALNTVNSAGPLRDTVVLNVNQGDHFEVMEAITSAIANPSRGHSDGFIVIADDVTTTDALSVPPDGPAADTKIAAKYIHGSITSCGDITVGNPSAGYGIHEYYEVVDLGTGDSGDVAALLSVYIPDDHVLILGGATVVEKATSNHGLVSMNYHSSSVAFDASGSGTTEWIGAAVSTGMAASADIDCDATAGVLGKSVTSHATQVNITTATYISLVAQEDLSSMTGTPKVGIYLKWMGSPAVAV